MNQQTITMFAISLATTALIFSALRMALHRSHMRRHRRLLESISRSSRIHSTGVESEALPLPQTKFVSVISNSRYGAWLRALYAKAGLWEESKFDSGISQKIAFLIASFIASIFLIQSTSIPTLYLVLLPPLAFLLPDLLVFRKAQNRVEAIAKSLPETIDLLGMCVTAGIGFHAGMQRVATSQENPLSQEFNRVLGEMKLGKSRSQALVDMSDRLQIPTLTEFVNSVLQVDRLGVPMARILEEQSHRMRTLRQERAREQAQKLPVKILAPIMLLMMPALLIIVLGPAVISIARSFG